MRLNEIKRVLSEILFFRNTLKMYGEVLKKGKYVIFPSMRAMVVDDKTSYDTAKRYFHKNLPKSYRVFLVNKLNAIGFFRNNRKSVQNYEAFYVANNYDKVRETKLFSFERKKILTICANSEDYLNQIKWHKDKHSFYNMPRIEENRKYKNSYEISMIDLLSRPGEEQALDNILCSVMRENEQKNDNLRLEVSEIIKFDYENKEMKVILDNISSHISPEILSLCIPLCEQHGDLSRDNLIYGQENEKTDFWWIDWEHLGNRMFLYDYFFYIFNTAVYFKDKMSFDFYINGRHNEKLKKYFNFFGIEFSENNLKDYFLVFVMEFLKERVCDLDNLIALKMYNNFLNELGLLEKI